MTFTKKHLVDQDSIMTEDDYRALQEYRIEKKTGKLTSHEQLKKELGLSIHAPLISTHDKETPP